MPDNNNISPGIPDRHGDLEIELDSIKNLGSLSNDFSSDIPRDKAMARLLVEMGVLDDDDVKVIDDYQKSHNATFENAAKALSKINKDDLERATAEYYKYSVLTKKDRRLYSKELVTASLPQTQHSESFRSIRSRILFHANSSLNGAEKCAFAVVSPDARDGRTYLSANLAVVFGQLGRNTILLDMDLRKPRVHKVFNVSNNVGISDVFAENSAAPNCWRQIPFISSLVVVPSGPVPPNPQELLSQPTFDLFLNNLYDVFDFVIIDTPPCTSTADAEIIASRVKSAIVVCRKHNTSLRSLESTVRRLKSNGVDVMGCIFNNH